MNALQFMEFLISVSLQVAVLVVITQWLTTLVSGERAYCRLWTICYVTLLVLVIAELLLPHPRLLRPWSGVDAQSTARLVEVQVLAGHMLFAVWLGGAAVSISKFAIRSWRVHRFLKTCAPIDASLLKSIDFATDASSQPSGSSMRDLRILVSPRITTPFCWQFHRPCVVLPEFLFTSGGADLRFILRHELEHLRTGHPLQLFLQRGVEILFWFHPMIWWASQQSARAREFACDAAAVDSRSEIAAYLRSLLTIVEHAALTNSEYRTTMTFGRSGTLVAERAKRLVGLAQGEIVRRATAIPFLGAAFGLVGAALLIAAIWLPVDPLASTRSHWSPWPTWSTRVLHDFGVAAPDFEAYDCRTRLQELHELASGEDVDAD